MSQQSVKTKENKGKAKAPPKGGKGAALVAWMAEKGISVEGFQGQLRVATVLKKLWDERNPCLSSFPSKIVDNRDRVRVTERSVNFPNDENILATAIRQRVAYFDFDCRNVNRVPDSVIGAMLSADWCDPEVVAHLLLVDRQDTAIKVMEAKMANSTAVPHPPEQAARTLDWIGEFFVKTDAAGLIAVQLAIAQTLLAQIKQGLHNAPTIFRAFVHIIKPHPMADYKFIDLPQNVRAVLDSCVGETIARCGRPEREWWIIIIHLTLYHSALEMKAKAPALLYRGGALPVDGPFLPPNAAIAKMSDYNVVAAAAKSPDTSILAQLVAGFSNIDVARMALGIFPEDSPLVHSPGAE